MSEIAKRARAARLQWVDLGGGKSIRVLMPQAYDMAAIATVLQQTDMLIAATTDWKGFTYRDFVSDGDESPQPFDRDDFAEWFRDRPDMWAVVIKTVSAFREKTAARREALLGNSEAPSESSSGPSAES